MKREERQAKLSALTSDFDEILVTALKPFTSKTTDLQKFLGAATFFDLCFNVPDLKQQQRIHQQVI